MTNDVFSFNGFPGNNFSRMFIGADKMLQTLGKVHEETLKGIPGYPPYNIAKVDENKYVIEMAVAGFGKQNIDIEIANNTLVVKGGLTLDQLDPGTPMQYLYKGIADRAFTRKFTLADTVEVKNAELINGMLKLWLENIIPEEKKPKKIDIVDKTKQNTKE
jgi:molecular chaperone IbpA